MILKVLNWGVYIGHEIFVMMKPGFLNKKIAAYLKAWLSGWWITIYVVHSQARTSCLALRLRVAYETSTRPTVDAH